MLSIFSPHWVRKRVTFKECIINCSFQVQVGRVVSNYPVLAQLARSTYLALMTDGGSLGFDPLRSKWWAPSGMIREITDLETLFKMPPEDHGSRRPLLKVERKGQKWVNPKSPKKVPVVRDPQNCFFFSSALFALSSGLIP